MIHAPEFSPLKEADLQTRRDELAGVFARAFSSPDGERALLTLLAKYPPDAVRFQSGRSTDEMLFLDGQRSVIKDIADAVARGLQLHGVTPTKPKPEK